MTKQLLRLCTMCMMLVLAVTGKAEQVTAAWDFHSENGNYYEQGSANIQGNVGTLEATASDGSTVGLTVDATSGKLYSRGTGDAQFNSGTVIKVPVKSEGDKVSVQSYPNYHNYTVGGEAADADEVLHSATAAEAKQGYVEIVATATAYLYSIRLTLTLTDGSDEGGDDTPEATSLTANWDFQHATPESITATNIQGTDASGTVASDVSGVALQVLAAVAGTNIKLQYNASGYAQFNQNTAIRVPVVSANDVVTVVSYPGQYKYTVGGTAAEGNETIHTATKADAKQGYVEIVATGTAYLYSISVVQDLTAAAGDQPVTLTDQQATATFPFHEGTDGQTADFGDAADYFLNSKVVLGSNNSFIDKTSTVNDIKMTLIEPTDKLASADEPGDIRFLIQPKFGFSFTPTKVALKASKVGTDNGTIDIAWLNADGTKVSLATGIAPERNNKNGLSALEYDVEGATPGEGACGLVVTLYGLQAAKQMGYADIVISGVLNGTEKAVPMLASFTAAGEEYAADKVFEANGDSYVATIELSKTVEMISASNPVSSAVALSGEVGEISYEGDATQCTVTIPVTLDDITINYIATFVQKPDFTLTYYNTDGSEMGTQTVEKDAAIGEFSVDYTTATAGEGQKVRGWFYKESGGQKFTTGDVITGDTKLYAVATDIEVSSDFLKYTFDLTDPYFYAEDHEAFNPAGDGFYWHDKAHGWAFKNGNTVDLLVGPKATITIALCQYGSGTAIVVKDANGNTLATLDGKSEADGGVAAYNYEGEPGTLTLEMQSSGEMYIHSVKIVNTTTTNYESAGQWFYVKAGDAKSLLDVIDAVNGTNAAKDAPRAFVFIPNGYYDLGNTCLTTLSGNNVSLIGESRDGTIIRNKPDAEGIGVTAVLVNTGENTYIQDLTLKDDWDYYGIAGDGRGVCLQDKGTNTICRNVALLSYQDTYYSNNNNMKAYWELCDIHGTVDFICGGGDVRFQDCTLSLESREASGKGSRTITAPTTTTDFGYVFDGCTIVDLANGAGDWNFGRTWQNQPICVYLNSVLDANAAATLIKTRWIEKGMNNTNPKLFGEYNTLDENGNAIAPASNTINSYDGQHETILTEETAGEFSYEKMFTGWDPASLTVQQEAPANVKLDGNKLTWDAIDGADMYLIEKNDEYVALTAETTYTIEEGAGAKAFAAKKDAENEEEETADVYTVRAANLMGGFGSKGEAEDASTGIRNAGNEGKALRTDYYTTSGMKTNNGSNGVVIKVETMENGKKIITKVMK